MILIAKPRILSRLGGRLQLVEDVGSSVVPEFALKIPFLLPMQAHEF